MASRVILQKKRNLLFNHFISQHTHVILGFSSVGIGQPIESSELDGLSWFPFSSSATTGHGHEHEHGRERNMYTVNNDDLEDCSASRFYLHNYIGDLNFGNRTEKIELVSLSRLGWTLQSVRYISTASANQSRLGSSSSRNGNEKSDTKQKKEASPEECDEAVEDLTTIKAKAKAKQLQEPHKSTESIVKIL